MGFRSGVKSHRSTPRTIVDQGVRSGSDEIGRFVLACCAYMSLWVTDIWGRVKQYYRFYPVRSGDFVTGGWT